MGLHILVLAGGSGTRLWPLSRAAIPKHLLPLGTGGKTLLRETVERVVGLGDSVHVVTAASQAQMCRDALNGLGLPDDAVIAEPQARGTGPALGLATHVIADTDPDAVVCSVHADHHIGDTDAYRAAVYAAAGWAVSTGGLATVGITPAYAATGFGYIEVGDPLDPANWHPPASALGDLALTVAAGRLEARESLGFHEKPALDVAERFISDGRHLWNLGLFAWPAGVFLAELRAADSILDDSLEEMAAARRAGNESLAGHIYGGVNAIAIEPLVFEHTAKLTVVRADFSWSDLGSWSDLMQARRHDGDADAAGNVVDGDAITLDSSNCLVASRGGRLVTVVGCSDLVVVDTGDALLVVPADQAQSVKTVVDLLKAQGRADLT